MKPLKSIQKRLIFAGAAKKNTTKKYSYSKKTKTPSFLTKLNSNMYIAGQISIAAISVAEHLNYSIPKLMSAMKDDEDSFLKHEQKGVKQLRPNFRFSRDYWSGSISYGAAPWYF